MYELEVENLVIRYNWHGWSGILRKTEVGQIFKIDICHVYSLIACSNL